MTMQLDQLSSLSRVSRSLGSLLCSPSPPPAIYVHSSSNTDLSLKLITQILDQNASASASASSSHPAPNYVQINLEEMLGSRNLFQSILNHLAHWHPPHHLPGIQAWNGQTCRKTIGQLDDDQQKEGALEWDYNAIANSGEDPRNKGLLAQRKSSSFDGFCEGLRIISNQLLPTPAPPRFIILHRPEFLRTWKDFNFLTAFTRLPELSGCSVHTIFVSPLPWHKLRPRYGAIDPTSISIPRLTDADLIQVLINDGLPEIEVEPSKQALKDRIQEVFTEFVRFLVATFNSQTSADLYELSILVNRLWPSWIAQIEERDLSVNDTARMIILFKPIIELEQKSYGSLIWHLPSFLTKPAGLDMDDDSMDANNDTDKEEEEDDDDTSTVVGSTQKKRLKRNDGLESPQKSTANPLLLSPSKTRVQQLIQTPFTTPSKPRHYHSILSPSFSTTSSQPGSMTSTRRHQFTIHLTPTTPRIMQSHHLSRHAATTTNRSSSSSKAPTMYPRQKTLDILSLSLPVLSRFLILAAFIASFNPDRSDITLFLTSNTGHVKKRKSRAPRKVQPGQVIRAKIRQRLLGPKTFTIGRLLAIFNAITDQEAVRFEHMDVLQQIGTLVHFKLLLRSGVKNNTTTTTTTSSASYPRSNQNKSLLDNVKLVISNLSCFNQSQILKISDSLNFNLLNCLFESED